MTFAMNATKPNILFILADDLGWNDVGYNNGSNIYSPHIDNLAYTGLILNKYYVQPICSATRAAFLTGRYPIHTGMQVESLSPSSLYGLPLKYKLLPQQLKEYGNYSTHLIGKWHLGYFNWSYVPNNRGFDTFFGYYNGQETYYNHSNKFHASYPKAPIINGYDLRNNSIPIFQNNTYSAYMYGNETIRLIDKYTKQ